MRPDTASWLWSLLGPVIGSMASLAATVAAVIVYAVVAPGLVDDIDALATDPWLLLASSAGLWFGFAVAFVAAARTTGHGLRDAAGSRALRASTAAFAVAVAFQGLLVAAASRFGTDGDTLLTADHWAGWLALGVVLVVGAPLFEELYFRGVLLPTLAVRLPVGAAVAVQAVAFGVVHFPQGLFAVGVVTLAGAALGALRVRTRSLWPCIAAHVAFNAVAFTTIVATTA